MSGAPPAGPPRGAPAARWYTHGWNRELSWRLIHAIVPRVPRPLRPPMHLVTTLFFYAVMPRERRAVRRNLARIAGRPGPAPHREAFRLFYNFSIFMVGYIDLVAGDPERLRSRNTGGGEMRGAVERLLGEGRGLVIVTLHLGQWETGLALLAGEGRPVHVVLREDRSAPSVWMDRARARPHMHVVTGDPSAWRGVDLLLALRRGETVVVMGDRAVGESTAAATVCGAPFPIVLGPLRLAQAAGAPILVIAVPMTGGDRFTFEAHGPLFVGPGDEGIAAAAAGLARIVETILRRYPTQWFNFYDVWAAAD